MLCHTNLCILQYSQIKLNPWKSALWHFKIWCFKIYLHSKQSFAFHFWEFKQLFDLRYLVPRGTHSLFHNTKIFFYIIIYQNKEMKSIVKYSFSIFFSHFSIFGMFLEGEKKKKRAKKTLRELGGVWGFFCLFCCFLVGFFCFVFQSALTKKVKRS